MADKTGIEWTDATWTPIRARSKATGNVGWHCEHASPGCINCYSETFNEKRLGTGLPFKPGHRADVEHFLDEAMLTQPLRWRRPRMVFVCSMTDLFGDWVSDEWIDRVFAVMALAPQHTFQVLTKRAERMRDYLRAHRAREIMGAIALQEDRLTIDERDCPVWPLPNVWLGVSAEDQRRWDERVPVLRQTSAAVRWVSAEPLLGPINGAGDMEGTEHHGMVGQTVGWTPPIDWVVVGGESGSGARPMHPDWARAIRDQCAAADVPFLFKQWGEFAPSGLNSERWLFGPEGHAAADPLPNGIGRHAKDGCTVVYRIGKKAAGRVLDGVTHDAFPHAEEVRFG